MSAIAFNENTVNANPQLLAPSITLASPGSFSPTSATLSISGLLAEDRISLRNLGTGAGQIGFSGGNITYGGVIIGTASGGVGSDFVVTFNASATLAAIEALIENITYSNVSDTPTASRTLILDVSDAAGVSALTPSFTQAVGVANPLNGLDVGQYSTPVFGDLDGDGDLDMVAGEDDGTLNYFENTGTATAAVFAAPVAIGSDVGLYSTPAFGDLDGDGDLDMIVGERFGTQQYFQNTGTATAPVFTTPPVAIGSDVDAYSAPALGDLDMVVGEDDGVLNYFENTGTATSPNFTTPPVTIGSDVGIASTIALGDIDGDGDLDMVVGEEDGVLNYFQNTGTATAPVFAAPLTIGSIGGSFSAVALADVDGDGDLDIVSGSLNGDFVTFITDGVSPITVNVTAQNDAPHISQVATSVVFAENTVNAQPQLLDADVTLTDPEGNFANGSVTVSGLLAEDVVSIRNRGTGAGQIGFSGGTITYGGVAIGTASGGAGATFTVTLNANATTAAVEALVENLTYANASDTPTASRTLVLDVRDGAGASAIASTRSFTQAAGAGNPLNGLSIGVSQFSAPVFGDLDGDGDLDMIAGENNGALNYFQNTGTAAAPVFAAPVAIGSDVGVASVPALGDLDGDGDLDMVVGELDGVLNYFQNTGTATAPVFAAPVAIGSDVGYWSAPALGDLDGDGDLDMVVGEEDGVLNYFENTGTATAPVFAAPVAIGSNVGTFSTPALGDLDGDGDLDMVVGEFDGVLNYFENTGTTAAPVFAAPVLIGSDVGLYSAPALADMNGDGYLDIVVGRADGDFVTFFNNAIPRITVNVTAQNDAPHIAHVATSVAFAENAVNAQPQVLDADVTLTDPEGNFANGSVTVSGLLAEDIVSIRNQGTGAGQIGFSAGTITYGGVAIGTASGGAGGTFTITLNANATTAAVEALVENLTYANASDTPTASRTLALDVRDGAGASAIASTPSFTQAVGAANPLNGLSIGVVQFSAPVFGDIDGDGDLDMIAGEDDGTLNYFQNTGTAAAPVFAAPVAIGSDVGFVSAPALGDLDGDGDLDMVVGEYDGPLNYFQNTGTAAAPVFAAPVTIGSNVGSYSTSALGDLDGDGDLDMVVGEADGVLNYFQNAGTATAPVFAAPVAIGSDVGYWSAPALGDLDGDGDLDMVVGEQDGVLNYFENTGTATAPVFAAPVAIGSDVGGYSAPALADMNGDGHLDIVVGRFDGDFVTFINNVTPRITVNVTADPDPTAGDDNLAGTVFNDTIDMLAGNDSYTGGNGDDTILGNSGNDTLNGGAGNDLIDGGADIDTASYAGASAGVIVTLRNTTTFQDTQGAGFDRLVGIENLIGSDFNDILTSDETGANELRGGLGNDRYIIYQASDVAIELAGQGTADRVDARANITLLATSEIETMFASLTTGMTLGGSDTANTMNGNTGNDTLNGNGGNDTLNGLDGNDTLNGGNGNDVLEGGVGNDVMNGGADIDTASYATATSAVTVSLLLATAQNTLGAGTDTLSLIENLTGSAHDDTLTGNNNVNTITGGSGNDTINARGGADTMIGGAGNDKYYVDNAGDVVTETGNAGSDSVYTTVDYTLGAGQTIEFLFANAGATALTLHGNELANNIQGNAGNDTLFGHDGNDILEGRGGVDDMTGGNGNDKYYIDNAADVLHEGASEGTLDIAYTSVSYTLGAGVYVELLYATSSAGLTLQGNELVNAIFGGAGNDTLIGGAGADTLTGNAGNDRLVGGAGIDTLFGNAGADVFVLQNLAVDRDTIRDFEAADQIEVSAALFGGGLVAGSLAANQFLSNGTGVAGDSDDRFVYNNSTGALYFDIDGSGATARVQIATLTGMPTLTAGDFTIVA